MQCAGGNWLSPARLVEMPSPRILRDLRPHSTATVYSSGKHVTSAGGIFALHKGKLYLLVSQRAGSVGSRCRDRSNIRRPVEGNLENPTVGVLERVAKALNCYIVTLFAHSGTGRVVTLRLISCLPSQVDGTNFTAAILDPIPTSEAVAGVSAALPEPTS
jgi:hypothetical protein